jgi:hypothetical protein
MKQITYFDFSLPPRCWWLLRSTGVLTRRRVEASVNNYHTTPRNTPIDRDVKLHTDDSHILGAIIQNLFATAAWSPGFVHPWFDVRTFCDCIVFWCLYVVLAAWMFYKWEYAEWINLAPDKEKWLDVVNRIMKLWVLWNAGIWDKELFIFWRRTWCPHLPVRTIVLVAWQSVTCCHINCGTVSGVCWSWLTPKFCVGAVCSAPRFVLSNRCSNLTYVMQCSC